MPDLIRVEEHQERILARVRPLPPLRQPLLDALGLAIAEDVDAPISLPPFDNSAMDGYAARAEDLAGAAEGAPVELPVIGDIGAGQSKIRAISPGTAAKIMTGAPVPAGADSVVPYEHTDRGVARVRVSREPALGANIRRVGEDVRTGDRVLSAGAFLGARQLGLLANLGFDTVLARPRPRVVVMATGSELRDAGSQLSHDAIYDGNSWLVAAAVREAGAIAYRVGIVGDDPRLFADTLSDQLVRADLIVTTGGVSQGDYDVVKEALAPLGTVWFGGVAMQPGKPQGFGVVGEDEVPICALPGNPVSAYVSFQAFVLPALRRMMGIAPAVRPAVPATCTAPFSSPPGKRQFARGRYDGETVTPIPRRGSHLVADLAEANALIITGEDTTHVEAGTTVDVLPLD